MAKKLSQLSVTMKQIAAVVPEFQNEYKKVTATEVGIELVTRTPMRSGQARANWRPGVGAPNISVKTGPGNSVGSIGELTQLFAGATKGKPVFLTNSLPYIGRLNNGYSAQAPSGFVQTAIKTGRQRARRKLKKLFGGLYNGR